MTVIRANFADLNNANFYKMAFAGYTEHPTVYDKIFNVKSSTRKTEYVSAVSGLAMPNSKAEGNDIEYDDPKQLYDGSVTHVSYAQGVRITKEAMDDDEYNVFSRLPSAMGRGFAQRVETEAANCFNNGFTTFTGADGVAMFATTHPKNPDEATTYITNTPAAAADLSVASLKAALTAFENMTDERGLKFAQKAKMLIVPSDLKWTAMEILESALEPYVAENTKNVLANGLELVVWPYLTDADTFFLASDKANHTLNFWWRTKFTVKKDSDFNSWDARYAAFMRFGLGVEKGWQGLYGVQGA